MSKQMICPKAKECEPVGYCDGKEPHNRVSECKRWQCPITGEVVSCVEVEPQQEAHICDGCISTKCPLLTQQNLVIVTMCNDKVMKPSQVQEKLPSHKTVSREATEEVQEKQCPDPLVKSGCEFVHCKYAARDEGGKSYCKDPNEYKNADGDYVCGRRDDAILVEPTPTLREQMPSTYCYLGHVINDACPEDCKDIELDSSNWSKCIWETKEKPTNILRRVIVKEVINVSSNYASEEEYTRVRLAVNNIESAVKAEWNHKLEEIAEEQDYSSGLLNDYGGGNISWWQDYIRAEVGRCNDYWRAILKQREG